MMLAAGCLVTHESSGREVTDTPLYNPSFSWLCNTQVEFCRCTRRSEAQESDLGWKQQDLFS